MRVTTAQREVRAMGEQGRMVRALGISAAILALIGCSEGAGPGPLAVEEAQDVRATGTVVAGTMSHAGRLTVENGAVHAFGLPSHSFAVPIDRSGVAEARQREPAATLEEAVAGLTPVVAVEATGPSARETRSLSFVDPSGQRHELRIVSSGRRVLLAEHRIDGELFSTVERAWRDEGRLSRLQGSSLVVQHAGRRVELNSTLSAATAFAGFTNLGTTPGAQPSDGYFVVEEDNEFYSCWGATLNLFAASGALATAIGTGNIPAIIIATAYYLSAVDTYNEQCR